MSSKASRRNSRRVRVPRQGRRDALALRAWMDAGQLESGLGWFVHEATDEQRADIAVRAVEIVRSLEVLHGVSDDGFLFALSNRVTAALVYDAMDSEAEDSVTDTELVKTLAAIDRELGIKAVV